MSRSNPTKIAFRHARSPSAMKQESDAANDRIRIFQATRHLGTKPQTFAEVDRNPKRSKKGSAVRRRAGQPTSIKVVRADAQRKLESARKEAKAAIFQAKALSHAEYLKAQEVQA